MGRSFPPSLELRTSFNNNKLIITIIIIDTDDSNMKFIDIALLIIVD